jgi:hypothetical protein
MQPTDRIQDIALTVIENADYDKDAALIRVDMTVNDLEEHHGAAEDVAIWKSVGDFILKNYTQNRNGQKSVLRMEPKPKPTPTNEDRKREHKNGRNYESNIIQRMYRTYSESEAVKFLVNNNRELRTIIGILESDIAELNDRIKGLKDEAKELKKMPASIDNTEIMSLRKQVGFLQSRVGSPGAKTINMFAQRIKALMDIGLKQNGIDFVDESGMAIANLDEVKLADDSGWESLFMYAKAKVNHEVM